MTDTHRDAWKRLRRLRRGGLAALLVFPAVGIAVAILGEPLLGESAHRVSMFIAVVPIVIMIRLITSFECPDCRKPFSSGGGRGFQLTNKRCVSCGLTLGS